MPVSDLTLWLQTRGFYPLLILALLVVGLLLALGRRRRDRPHTPHKPSDTANRPGRRRPR